MPARSAVIQARLSSSNTLKTLKIQEDRNCLVSLVSSWLRPESRLLGVSIGMGFFFFFVNLFIVGHKDTIAKINR